MENNIVLNHKLEEYKNKYRNRRHKLLKFTKKEVEDFDIKNHTNKGYLLERRKWWLIGDTYYQIPKVFSFTWFRNLNSAVQIGTCLLGAGVIGAAVAVPIVVLNNKAPVAVDNSIYRLEFNDNENLGKNTSKKKNYKDATIVGGPLTQVKAHKSTTELKFCNNGYIDVPTAVLTNLDTTISMWVKMPNELNEDCDDNPLFGVSFSNGYFYASPYSKESWNGYALHSKFRGINETNLTKVEASDKVYDKSAPIEGTLQSVAGAWQLIGFSFTRNNLTVYQNGKLMLTYNGDYSLVNKNITSFRIGSSANSNKSFNGSITDVRVYNKVLYEEDYKNEYATKYNDFESLNLNFNNKTLEDSTRNFNGIVYDEAKENVTFENKDNRNVVHLNGAQKEMACTDKSKSGFYLPNQVLLGHNELTINTNIYFEPRVDEDRQHLRLFEFSSTDGKRFLSFYYTMYDTNRVRLEVMPNQEKEFTTPWVTSPDFIMPTGKWLNLSIVLTPKKGEILVDGKVVCHNDDITYSPSYLYDYNNCSFFIGRSNCYGDFPLHCYIDDFRMYSTALSDSDIQDLLGNVHNYNDSDAIQNAIKNFNINKCMRDGNGKLYPITHLEDGVRVDSVSHDRNVIDEDGYIIYKDVSQTCNLEVTFSRNFTKEVKEYTISIPARTGVKPKLDNNNLADAGYLEGSYQKRMQDINLDWMIDLDSDRLLYSYRHIANLDTKGVNNYGSWIRTGCGGEGQFQAEYIGALARITNFYAGPKTAEVTKAREKLKYLLTEIRKCQEAYPNSIWGGEDIKDQKGYLNAFTHYCFYGMEHGYCKHVGYNKGPGFISKDEFKVPENITIWVPFYMYHKQLMMCYDVMTYANMGSTEETNEIRSLAKTMFLEASDWMKREVFKLNEYEREMALRVEWGGMAEAMYLAYRASGDADYLKVAHFFEEEGLIDGLHDNSNLLSGIHTNTTLPKIISCCAAYEVVGDPYYLQAAINAWDMMVNHMSFPNGGISVNEHFEHPDVCTQKMFGEETCCSYNMLRLTDYLYRLTGDCKYAHYFERVYYNHILSSIDVVGDHTISGNDREARTSERLQLAGKAYVTSTDFGHHKVYSSIDDSFWCCVATGSETFSKLTYGNFYFDNETEDTYVNMYNNIGYVTQDNKYLIISGINHGDINRGSEYVEIRTESGSLDLSKFYFIKPYWANGNSKMSIGDEEISYDVTNGYMHVNRVLSENETLKITLPMHLYATYQRGYMSDKEESKYSYALHYGPYVLTPDLGIQNDDIHHRDGTDSFQQYQYAYKGNISQIVKFKKGESYNNLTKSFDSIEPTGRIHTGLKFTLDTDDSTTLTYRPFLDICYERYSLYMYYSVEFPN